MFLTKRPSSSLADEGCASPHKRYRIDFGNEDGKSPVCPSSLGPKFADSGVHCGSSDQHGLTTSHILPSKRAQTVGWNIDMGCSSLPPRHRRPRNQETECKDTLNVKQPTSAESSSRSSHPVAWPSIEIIDLTKEDGEAEDNAAPSVNLQNSMKQTTSEDDSSESDSESDASTPERISSSAPTHTTVVSEDIDTLPDLSSNFDLEYLNSSARQLIKHVDGSKSHPAKHGVKSSRSKPSSGGLSVLKTRNVHVVPIPKSAFNVARRVIVPEATGLPLVTVSMRADVQFFHRSNRHRISRYSIPNDDGYRHVVDATVIAETAVIAYGDGPTQVSLLSLTRDQRPSLLDIKCQKHKRPPDCKLGHAAVSCLAPYVPNQETMRFFTGGYDKTIRLWSVNPTEPDFASSREVLRMGTKPDAIAYRQRGGTVLVATSRKLLQVNFDNLSRKPASFPMSNVIHQLHIHKEASNLIILEVDNLDHQIQIYDDRKKGGFDRASDCSFGGRFGIPAKFSKGDSHLSLFAKGFDDGTVCIWDFRNAKHPVLCRRYRELGSIVHASFLNMDLVCYGKNGLTFLDILAGETG